MGSWGCDDCVQSLMTSLAGVEACQDMDRKRMRSESKKQEREKAHASVQELPPKSYHHVATDELKPATCAVCAITPPYGVRSTEDGMHDKGNRLPAHPVSGQRRCRPVLTAHRPWGPDYDTSLVRAVYDS